MKKKETTAKINHNNKKKKLKMMIITKEKMKKNMNNNMNTKNMMTDYKHVKMNNKKTHVKKIKKLAKYRNNVRCVI